MNTPLRILLAALSLLPAAAVMADDRAPIELKLTTQDDDLRAGGEVAFVLRMFDGTEQATTIVRGERLADQTTSKYTVGPKAPYSWGDVKDWGLHARPHPGDGLALRPDTWRVYAVLVGTGGSCTNYTDMTRACFGWHNASWQFSGDSTQWQPLNAVLGKCRTDAQCNSDNFCGTGGKWLARCAPTNAAADRHGCLKLRAPEPVCPLNLQCNAQQKKCIPAGCEHPDVDGDGHDSIACGGDDCDDNDPTRYPGRSEVCDGNGHDEDCDPTTIGKRDQDGDGFIDGACWNAR